MNKENTKKTSSFTKEKLQSTYVNNKTIFFPGNRQRVKAYH